MPLNGTSSVITDGQALFSWVDHAVFALMLLASGAVGVYYGVFRRKDNTSKEDYLLGGKSMAVLPIAISQAASHTSGTTLVGVPTEIYMYGTAFSWSCLSAVLVSLAINYVYLPVFFGLQVTSAFEYLEKRYNKTLRVIASGVFAFSIIIYMPFYIYVPALVFNQVSGISVHLISPAVCAVCIFYTMLGGLKAVVWTDVLQSVVGLAAIFAVLGLGLYHAGGPSEVWRIADEGGRLRFFDMTLDPFVRSSFWTVTLGMTAQWLGGRAINQDMVQRFIALPDLASAKKSLVAFTLGIIITNVISIYTGLLLYSIYHDCDPVKSNAIRRPDQLLPHYVMQVAGHLPALPGLYVAGVFSAALSSMSSVMNALAGTIYEDFIQPHLSEKASERKVNIIMMTIVLVVGAVGCVLVLLIEQLGTVLELAHSTSGLTNGELLGIFTLGMLFPWANWKGAAIGSVSGIALMVVMAGAQHAFATGRLDYPRLPMSVEGCAANVTAAAATASPDPSSVPMLFRVSYLYYSLMGTVVVMVVGAVASFATGATDPTTLDPSLLAPQVRWIATRGRKKAQDPRAGDEDAQEVVTELLERGQPVNNTTSLNK